MSVRAKKALKDIFCGKPWIYVFMDPCLGYVNAYIWTPNFHVMTVRGAEYTVGGAP